MVKQLALGDEITSGRLAGVAAPSLGILAGAVLDAVEPWGFGGWHRFSV